MRDPELSEFDGDVVVIGAGAAGLSAALVLARARRRVVVVDDGSPRNAPAVWAAGNVIDPRALVVVSAGMGAAAGFDINLELTDEDVDHAVRQRHAVEPAGGAGR